MRKKFIKKVLPRLLGGFAPALIRFLGWSLRYEVEDPAGFLGLRERGAVLFVFWHNRILLMPYLCRRFQPHRKQVVLMSQSRDGSFIADISARFDIGAIRGSSSKGAIPALLKIHRLIREGGVDFALTPDGPRGPKYHIHAGILQLGRKSGLPIVPVTLDFDAKWELNSWDRFQIPRPFTRCRMRIGSPVPVGTRSDDEVVAELRAAMEDGGGKDR